MIHYGSGSLFLVLIYLTTATGIVSDSFDAGVESRNVAVGKSLSMWCGMRHRAPDGLMYETII